MSMHVAMPLRSPIRSAHFQAAGAFAFAFRPRLGPYDLNARRRKPSDGCGCSSVVEHNLAKVGVEGSNPFARSKNGSQNNDVDKGCFHQEQRVGVLGKPRAVAVKDHLREGLGYGLKPVFRATADHEAIGADVTALSVILKTLNEEAGIAEAIESVLVALEPLDGETIIADGGSTDATVAIASRYPVRVVQLDAGTPPSCGIGPQLGFQYSTRALGLPDGRRYAA